MSTRPHATGAAAAAVVAAAAGHGRRLGAAEAAELADLVRDAPDARVRAAALGALARAAPKPVAIAAWRVASTDVEPSVRRRAAETAPALGDRCPVSSLLGLLDDGEPFVAEAAAFALGERRRSSRRTVAALAATTTGHPDPLVREAAVAALGAIGDPGGLRAVLAATDDKPAVRRRAILALAAFDGPEVEARIQRALDDRDWQVRQAAEDLLAAGPS